MGSAALIMLHTARPTHLVPGFWATHKVFSGMSVYSMGLYQYTDYSRRMKP